MALLPFFQPPPLPALPLSDFTDKVITDHWIAEGWGPVAFYALIISVFFVALAYMIAEILGSPQLNAWAKSELYEVIVSALIIGNLFFILTFSNLFVYEMTGGLDHFAMAERYLDELVSMPDIEGAFKHFSGDPTAPMFGDLSSSYVKLIGVDAFVGFLGSFFTQIPVSEAGIVNTKVGLAPYAGLSQLSPTLFTLTDMVGIVLMAMLSQKALLTFFKESMFSMFLPLGITLRTFPLSRKLGSTIIAIAITCYIIYPLTLVMNMGIYDSVPKEDVLEITQAMVEKHNAICPVKIGDPCVTDADCCDVPCYEDYISGTKECNIFPPGRLYGSAYISDYSGGCATSDPDTCTADADCPCSGRCITYPDEANPPSYTSGSCGFPTLNQDDFLAIINTDPSDCSDPSLLKCWWVRNMARAPGTRSEVGPISENLVLYFVSPVHMPAGVFEILETWLPKIFWPVIAAVVLSVVDIIICITFFKSISEAIGGETSILGLTRAL